MDKDIASLLLERGFSQNDLDMFSKRGFPLEVVGQMYAVITHETPTLKDQTDYKTETGFNQFLFAVDRVRSLMSVSYNPEGVVKLFNNHFSSGEILEFSGSGLTVAQIANLMFHLGRTKQEILDFAKGGLSIKDISQLTLWGLPERQVSWLKLIGLNSGQVYDIREKGMSEQNLILAAGLNKSIKVGVNSKFALRCRVARSEGLDYYGNIGFELVFRKEQYIGVLPGICGSDARVLHPKYLEDLTDFEKRRFSKPLYLNSGFFMHLIPEVDPNSARVYVADGSLDNYRKFSQLDSFLKAARV